MNNKGFVKIVLIIGVIIVIGIAGYFLLVKKSSPIILQPNSTMSTSQLSTPTPLVTTPTPSPKDATINKNIKQGIFGTVSTHAYGCGQAPQDGSGCDMKGVNKTVGEGIQVTVNVTDKIDSYGNVNSQHSIASYYTDQKGTYKAYLNPGNYIMCVKDGDCSHVISVELDKFTEVNLSIDLRRP